MRKAQVQALDNRIYGASIHPYISKPRKNVVIFGLDTEWRSDSKGNHLLCWQLSLNKKHTRIYTSDLNWNNLYNESVAMLKCDGIKLSSVTVMVYAVFLATAEAQWLLADGLSGNKIEIYGSHKLNIFHRIRKNRNMYMFDLSNWYDLPDSDQNRRLSTFAQTFGLEKLSYDVSNLPQNALDDPEFVAYAENDAWITGKILRELRLKILDDSGIDILLSKTPANTAANQFRKEFVPRVPTGEREMQIINKNTGEIKERTRTEYQRFRNDNAEARRFALYASHGGRKEMFFRGQLPYVYEYDASSAYPSSAIQLGVLPLGEHIHEAENIWEWLNARGGWGMVEFKFPDNCKYPCLPVEEGTDKLIYPLEGISNCTTFQVDLAMEMGAQITMLKGYYYNDGVTWLADYLKTLVHKKETTTDPVAKAIYKLMANSIVGKLTQKRKTQDINQLIRKSDELGIPVRVLQYTINKEDLGIKTVWKHGTCCMPEWNTLILGWYQANISRLCWKHNAVQVATDAFFTTEYLGEGFESNGIHYKIEEEGEYVAYRPGLYRINIKKKHQGGTRQAAEDALEQFMPDRYGVEYKARRIVSLRQSLNSDMKMGVNYIIKQTLRLGYDGKRILHSDGTTIPLRSVEDCKNNVSEELVWHETPELVPT